MNAYIADQSWADEAERLRRLERALDSYTVRYLDGIGVTAGMSCLEIGAGQGNRALVQRASRAYRLCGRYGFGRNAP